MDMVTDHPIAIVVMMLHARHNAPIERVSHVGDGSKLHAEARGGVVEISLETKHDLTTHTMSREDAAKFFAAFTR